MGNVTQNLIPKYIARTIAAGARERIGAYGRYITVIGISASTITLSIQDDDEQLLVNGIQIDCQDRRYDHFVLHNTGGVASTVTLYLSETIVVDLRDNALIAALAASAAAIEQEISGGAAPVQLANLALPASPAAGAQVFAANAARTEVEVTAPETNGGFVYLGITAARCTAGDKFFVLYPGGIWWSSRYKGAIFASGNDALEMVNGKEN